MRLGFLEKDVSKMRNLTNADYHFVPYILVEAISFEAQSLKVRSRKVIAEKVLDQQTFNFTEGDHFSFRVAYHQNTLSAYIGRPDSHPSAQFDSFVALGEYLGLDNGRGFVGLLCDGFNSSFQVDVRRWSLQGFNAFNQQDPWGGLALNYLCAFPNNLVFTDTVLELYQNVFKLLFPVKNVQVRLNQAWSVLSLHWKKSNDKQLFSSVSSLRSKMSFFIDNLLSYFYIDVLEVRWGKLKDKFSGLKEFEQLRQAVSEYLDSIYLNVFLHQPSVIKSIFGIVDECRHFIAAVEKLEEGDDIYALEQRLLVCRRNFDQKVVEFMRLIDMLNQGSSSQSLSQLLIRLNFNHFYRVLNTDMDIEAY